MGDREDLVAVAPAVRQPADTVTAAFGTWNQAKVAPEGLGVVVLTVHLVLPVNAFRALPDAGLCRLDDLAWSALEPLYLARCVLDVSRRGGEPHTAAGGEHG